MANLYGRLQGSRGEATRIGHSSIKAKLETWDGSVEVELEKDGTFTVRIGDKSYPRIEIAIGNVNDRSWYPGMGDEARSRCVTDLPPIKVSPRDIENARQSYNDKLDRTAPLG